MAQTAIGKTPFSLAYGVEAMMPVEVGLASYRWKKYEKKSNIESMKVELDLLIVKRD